MRSRPSVTRDLGDTLLLRLCMRPLGEAAEDLFAPMFKQYASLLQRDRDATAGVAEPVTSVLMALAGEKTGSAHTDESTSAALHMLRARTRRPRLRVERACSGDHGAGA